MPVQEQCLYDFGPFRLDPVERRLLQDGRQVPLTPKAFQTLLVLVQNQGRVIEKEELLRRVWPDTFVEEATLAQNIFTLRKQLGDDRSEGAFIETVPKLGYRFVAPVRQVEFAKLEELSRSGFPERPASLPLFRRMSLWLGMLLGCVGAIGALFSVRYLRMPQQRTMLCVLPVQNLAGNEEHSYVADGLTEEMISQLGAMDPQHLGVIARTSSMAYKGTTKTIEQIGRELNVNYVLETSLRESGQRMRITAQLINSRDQARMWSQEYDAAPGDLVAVEEQIARAVGSEIHLRLQPQAQQRLARTRAENPESRDLYLQGRYYWNQRSRDGLSKSVSLFYQAAEKDPSNARAYAGIADAYNMEMFYGYSPGAGTLLKAKAAAQRAIELDDSLAEGHAALAYMDFMWLWEWPDAEKEFQRAITLNANYVSAHHWYGLFLSAMGRHEEAMQQVTAARAIDPVSPVVRAAAGLSAYYARNYDQAVAEARSALAINPNFVPAHTVLGRALEQKKMYPEALAEYKRVLDLAGSGNVLIADLGHLYGVMGKATEATAIIKKMDNMRTELPYVSFSAEGLIYAGLNDDQNAIEYLVKANQQNDAGLIWVWTDPRWDKIRPDPRIKALLPPPTSVRTP